MKPLRYGIISTASIAGRFVQAVQATAHSQVVAVASRSITKAQTFASQYQISRAYGSYSQLYQDQDIDIVYIATINSTHAAEIRAALLAGKHVLCEKPLVLTTAEAEELFALAQTQGRFLMEAQKSVFLPVTNFLKKAIHTSMLGGLKQIDMTSSFTVPASQTWMYDPLQGGVVYGSATYTIEYISYLLEQKASWSAVASKTEAGCIEAVSMHAKFGSSILAASRIAMNVTTCNEARFYFTEGMITVKDYWKARSCTVHSYHTQKTTVENFPCLHELRYEADHVYECLQAGLLQSPIMNEAMTLHCAKQVEDILQTS